MSSSLYKVEVITSSLTQGSLNITNRSGQDRSEWSLQIETKNFAILDPWQFNMEVIETKSKHNVVYKIMNKSWNGSIKSGETKSGLGFSCVSSGTPLQLVGDNEKVPSEKVPTKGPRTDKLVGIYFTEWSIYARQFNPSMIPVDKINTILYAFLLAQPTPEDLEILKKNYPFPPVPYRPEVPEGTVVYHDEWAATGKSFGGVQGGTLGYIRKIKQENPHIQFLLSIGGWSLSWNFSKIARDDTLRARFVKSAVEKVIEWEADGVDIDWEFVGKQGPGYNYVDEEKDKEYVTWLMRDLRAEMKRVAPERNFIITAATGADPKVVRNYEGTIPYLDYLFLMSYDYMGAWGDGGHQSGLYGNPDGTNPAGFWVDEGVKVAKEIGFSEDRIAIGSPFYGRGWKKLENTNSDIPVFGKSVDGPAPTYSGVAGEPGVSAWRHIKEQIKSGKLKEGYDNIAKASYATSDEGEAWTFDTPESIVDKVKYAVDKNNLAGMFAWEISDDSRDGDRSLIDAMSDTMVKLSYKESPSHPLSPLQPEPTPSEHEPTPSEPEPTPSEPEPTPSEPAQPQPEPGVFIVNNTDSDIVIKSGEKLNVLKWNIN